jgi:hypothetical protein
MMPPGHGRLVGLKRGFTSLSGEVKSIQSEGGQAISFAFHSDEVLRMIVTIKNTINFEQKKRL